MDLPNIHRTFHPNTKENNFCSDHATLSKLDDILGSKASLKRYNKQMNKQTTCILAEHNELKRDLNNNRNFTNTSRSNNLLLTYELRQKLRSKFKTFL